MAEGSPNYSSSRTKVSWRWMAGFGISGRRDVLEMLEDDIRLSGQDFVGGPVPGCLRYSTLHSYILFK